MSATFGIDVFLRCGTSLGAIILAGNGAKKPLFHLNDHKCSVVSYFIRFFFNRRS